ncbi:flagellar filament capping protein FliD [Microbacterium suaedae]|uniref:flagellar filament capping protein FliD n=1 Tax=Microbacterium suaedae TaxID=2067813 RepID=UPI000DA1FA9A|nr:flagellar filament capping protein FliD [Microbacterium suaedae]
MNIPGLASNMDTAAMIDALMNVQAIPQQQLKAQISDRELVVSNLQSLNTSLQSLATGAAEAASADALQVFTTSSSDESVTVIAGEGARAFQTDIVVDQTARAHSIVTAAGSADDWGGSFTLVSADGTEHQIVPEGTSAESLAAALNDAGAGVSATVVSAGVAGDGSPLSRIQITAQETGAPGSFTLHRGDATGTDLSTEADAAVIAQGQDAQVRLYAGTAAEQIITSSTNTFDALASGVDITVSAVTTGPVAVGVAIDEQARAETAGEFVAVVADILARIDKGSTATVAGPGESTTLGVFTGDSTVRSLRTDLANAIQRPVDGRSPSEIGISIDRHGVLSFDEEKFSEAMEADPAGTEQMFQQIALRVQQTTEQYSDKYDGQLTQRITGQESFIANLESQDERWDTRLEQRRATLERQYATLETLMAKWNSQESWLTQQIDAMNASQN